MASRWSSLNVLSASRACHMSALVMEIDVLARARVALWAWPSTLTVPVQMLLDSYLSGQCSKR